MMSVCASICLFVFFPEFLKTAELIEIIFLRTILLGVHMDLGKESGRGQALFSTRFKKVGVHLSLKIGMRGSDNYSTFSSDNYSTFHFE